MPISRKSPRATSAGLRNGLRSNFGTGQLRGGLGAWPVAFDGGPYQTLLCSWVQLSDPTSRPAYGRVNASIYYWVPCYECRTFPLDISLQDIPRNPNHKPKPNSNPNTNHTITLALLILPLGLP